MRATAIDQIEVEHARFNAAKTLSTVIPSEFEHTTIGGLQVTRDRSRSDPYYNRLLGLTTETLPDVHRGLSWIAEMQTSDHRIRIDIDAAANSIDAQLHELGFDHEDSLVWLCAEPDPGYDTSEPRPANADVQPLTSAHWVPLRELLEQHGPISDQVWEAKRHYLCTATFQWVGIFEGDRLASAASTWTTDGAAVLGSAFTLPAWRGRGYHRQLLEYRRRAATARLLVDVEPESISHRNCVRAGFTELEHRHVWVRR